MPDIRVRFVLPILLLGDVVQAPMVLAQSAGTFTATGNMVTARSGHTATLLQDGRVLIAGGVVVVGFTVIPLNSAELYDPSTSTFTANGSMTTPRGQHTATLLPSGRVLISGGDALGSSDAELYDPATGTFTPTSSMAAPHGRATLLGNGKVLMTGGFTQTRPAITPNAELYDPATGTLTATGAYADWGDARQLTATLLADGRVLITGCSYNDGDYCEYGPADVGQLYHPATGTFSLTGGYGFSGGTTTLLTNGKVLFAGGTTEFSWNPYSKLYDPSTGIFTRAGDMTSARDLHTATLLPDGEVLITGGRLEDSGGHSNPSAELYNPSTGTFRPIGNMTARRGYHAATLLQDGRVLITGGLNVNATGGPAPPTNLSSAELYTPAVVVPAPALFLLSGDGQGQGVIWHAATGQLASAADPAVTGEALSMYTNNLVEGGVIPPQVAIGGRLAEVLYFGAAPGYPGCYQVNLRVPSGVAPGPAVPVRLTYLDRPSNAVTIGVH